MGISIINNSTSVEIWVILETMKHISINSKNKDN